MDLREKIGPAVEAAEPSSNGQAPGAAGNGTSEAGSRAAEAGSGGAGRTVNGHRRTLLSSPHPYPGRLIAVEGIDGSGKSTQVKLLERWLRARGYPVHFTEWNSSRLVRNSMRRGKRRNLLTPSTFSLLHAVDFADRFIYQILPPLRAGMIVLADRYVYTAFARDVARGVHPDWVRGVYRFAPRPDLTFFFRVPIDISLERLLAGRAKLKYYEAGMDLGLSTDLAESFRLFQGRVLEIYDQLAEEFDLRVIDASHDIAGQQKVVRRMTGEILREYDRQRARNHHGSSAAAR
jgi:dTMP kinase